MEELKAVREVLNVLYGDSCRLPVQFNTRKLIKAISAVTGYQITHGQIKNIPELRGMLFRFESGDHFRGYIDRHPTLRSHLNITDECLYADKVALILVSEDEENNECWRRFTVVKEAAHLLVEADELGNYTDVTRLANVLANTASLDQYESLSDEGRELLLRDYSGIEVAIQLFMPESTHKEWMTRQVHVEGKKPIDLAITLKLPQKFVEARMREFGLLAN